MKRYIKSSVGLCLAAATLLSFSLVSVYGEQLLSVRYNMPVHVSGKINETGCDNSGGPTITFEGGIALGGLTADVLFENNLKGTHQVVLQYSTNVTLVPFGCPFSIPKQPSRGGVGGNPHIWIQFYDHNDGCLTDEIYLGRCVQGFALENDFLNDVVGAMTLASGDCSGKGGPTVTLGGNLTLSGLKARFIFRNNMKGTHTAEAYSDDVQLIIHGTAITIPKQPCRGGVGGNPIIGIQFKQCDGAEITDPIILGRCNKL